MSGIIARPFFLLKYNFREDGRYDTVTSGAPFSDPIPSVEL